MADYDLGRAHGRIVVDYDDKGTDEAQQAFEEVEQHAEKLGGVLSGLSDYFSNFSTNVTGDIRRLVRGFALLTGGVAILSSLGRGGIAASRGLFALRGASTILGILSLRMSSLPKSIQGFPKIVKQVVLLSTAIKLLGGSSELLADLIHKIPLLSRFAPGIRNLGQAVNKLARPIHLIAGLVLTVGALKSGVRIAMQLAKALGMVGLAAGGIALVTKTLQGAYGAVKQLSGLVALLPGALALVAGVLGTVVVGLHGFQDALKVMDDVEKFEEALKKLSPSAAAAARAIKKIHPQLMAVKNLVQERIFAGMDRDIYRLASLSLPVFSIGLQRIASQLRNAREAVVTFLSEKENLAQFGVGFAHIEGILNNLVGSLGSFLRGLLNLTVDSLGAIDSLVAGFSNFGTAFEAWTLKVRADGSIKDWAFAGVEGVKSLWHTLLNLHSAAEAFFGMFRDNGSGALKSLELLTGRMASFLHSTEGQAAIQPFIDTIRELSWVTSGVLITALQELGPVLVALLPFITAVSEAMGGTMLTALRTLGPILTFIAQTLSKLSPVLGPVLGFLLGLGIAVKAVVLGFGLLVSVLKLAGAAFTIISTVLKAIRLLMMANPWFLLIAAIILIAYLIYKNWDAIKAFLIKVWDFIVAKAKAVWEPLSAFFVNMWNKIKSVALTTWNFIKGWLERIWTAIVTVFRVVWSGIVAYYTTIWNILKAVVMTVVGAVVTVIKTQFNIIKTIIFTVIGAIRRLWMGFWGIFGGIITAALNLVLAIVQFWIKLIVTIFKIGFNFLVAAVRFAWETIKAVFLAAFNAIIMPLLRFFGWLKAQFLEGWAIISAKTAEAWNWIADKIGAVWNWITDKIGAAAQWIWDKISGIWNAIVAFTQDKWSFWSALIQAVWQAITDYIGGKLQAIRERISSAWDTVKNLTSQAWQAVERSVIDPIERLVRLVAGLGQRFLSALGNLGSLLYNKGRDLIQGLIDGIESKIRALTDKIKLITNMLPGSPVKSGPLTVLNRAHKLLSPHGEAVVEGFADSLANSTRRTLEGAFQGLDFSRQIPMPRSPAGSRQPVSNTNNSAVYNIYNPRPESASESIDEVMRRRAEEGAFR